MMISKVTPLVMEEEGAVEDGVEKGGTVGAA